MSYHLIEESMQKIGEITSWKPLLIEYNHAKKPNEFTSYKMNFKNKELLDETVSSLCTTFLKIVNKYDRKILEYTGFNGKNIVDKISIDNPLITTSWNALKESMNVYDDTKTLKEINANAFILVGTYNDEKNVPQNIYLITKKNPVISFKKGRAPLLVSQHNVIDKTSEPLIQLGKSFDALIYKNVLYMINSNCEYILNMEYSHKKICQKSLTSLSEANIINDIDLYKEFATSGHMPKKFITYDNDIVEKLKELKWQKKLASDLKIPLNTKNKTFDLSNPEHAKNFTLAICGKTKLNMFLDGVCEVPASTPINFS